MIRHDVPASRYIIFFALALVGLGLDLWTKSFVFAKFFDPLSRPDQYWFIPGWLGIECSTNPGALFGFGKGNSHWFALLSVIAACGIVYWLFIHKAAQDLILTIALGSITGGIFGNLYDRLGLWHGADLPSEHHHTVRDWIHFRWPGGPRWIDPWPNFNIADALLVCGATLLFLHAVFQKNEPPTESTPK